MLARGYALDCGTGLNFIFVTCRRLGSKPDDLCRWGNTTALVQYADSANNKTTSTLKNTYTPWSRGGNTHKYCREENCMLLCGSCATDVWVTLVFNALAPALQFNLSTILRAQSKTFYYTTFLLTFTCDTQKTYLRPNFLRIDITSELSVVLVLPVALVNCELTVL